ncbi:unnamed protein product [Moneuplotes crassus]|uniref:Uncharacterized protein n=1 Tax=Euplotes crassus TaxID=5936 RepID=A0AAD1UIN5_EUPCR|nr:unnamed protein product [Moneuplotes crassus]
MNNFFLFDENLSEDFLDENVSVSSINTSPNLEKNMAERKFDFGVKEKKATNGGFLLDSQFVCKNSPVIDNSLKLSDSCVIQKEQRKLKPASKSSIQTEIKSLLQKAILIRNSACCQKNNRARHYVAHRPAEKTVTMKDVKSADFFSN